VLFSFLSLKAMKHLLLAAGLWLAVSGYFLSGQQEIGSTVTGYTLRGSVLDSTTEQPIARVLVQIAGGNAVLTDNNGDFEFSDVPPGQHTIMVRRPGYLSNYMDSRVFAAGQDQVSTYAVSVGSNTAPLAFSLAPEAILTGQVTLLNSDPADGFQVTAYRKSIENGRSTWSMAGMATTNSEGIFRIASLSPGSYLLITQPPPDLSFTAASESASWGYPSVYYPGVQDASAASIFTLTAGEHKEADMTLTRQTFYPVTIRVANVQPGDFVNLDVRDVSGRYMNIPTHYNAQQQIARTKLPAGNYLLDARAFDIRSGHYPSFGRREFTVSVGTVTDVGITVFPLRKIPVSIQKEFTESGGETTSGITSRPDVNLQLVAADETFGDHYVGSDLQSLPGSNDGTSFLLENVPPGKYWVEVGPSQDYVSSITSGGVDLMRDVLTVGAGGASAPIEITLRNDWGSIDGTINASPASSSGVMPEMWIYAIPLFATDAALPTMVLNRSGSFSFKYLAPGSYRVVACDTPQEIEFHTPEGLAAWAGKGQVVSVEAGGTAQIQLDITSTVEQTQ
jgi:Carboxypeptidase regulatory-like domain